LTREERHALVLELKAQGLSFSQISRRVGIRWEAVVMICRKAQRTS
jgi:transcriptional regulator